jgi:hypothetical protein
MNSPPTSDNAGASDPTQVLPSRQQQHQHQHHAFDDVLNEEAVENDDQAIECAEEADNKRRLELESSQNVLTNRDHINNNIDGLGLDHTNTLSNPPSYDQTFGNRLRCHGKIMRHHENSKVTNVELFFDLVFVYASTLLSFSHLFVSFDAALVFLFLALHCACSCYYSCCVGTRQER